MEGIIVQIISNQYKVVDEKENVINCIARGKLRNNEIVPVVGDRVKISENAISEILPRHNYIKRPKIANITQIVLVVSSKEPKPDILLLDKQIAFAENLGVKVVIAINKTDLANIKDLAEVYKKIGYPVIEMQAKNGIGINSLRKYLKNNITVFSGNSGVGKSSIINALFCRNITSEGEVSNKSKRGKNTTTAVTLYELEKDTFIADTPGFSTFDINELEYKNLDKEFKEFLPYIEKCKYVGCSHIYESEAECQIKQEVKNGNINMSRYENYKKIYEEIKNNKKY